jgi:hypothetical protein
MDVTANGTTRLDETTDVGMTTMIARTGKMTRLRRAIAT